MVTEKMIWNYLNNNLARLIREYSNQRGTQYNYTFKSCDTLSSSIYIEIKGEFDINNEKTISDIRINTTEVFKYLCYGITEENPFLFQLDVDARIPIIKGEQAVNNCKTVVSLRILYLIHLSIKETYNLIKNGEKACNVNNIFTDSSSTIPLSKILTSVLGKDIDINMFYTTKDLITWGMNIYYTIKENR